MDFVKVNKSNFEPKQIKPIWRELLKAIMEFFTLDDRFMKIYGYHFVFLNQFRHKVKIYFPFYLLSSLNANINEHRENPHINPVLHQGLILLIYEHCKARAFENPNKAPSVFDYDGEGSGSSENRGWDTEDDDEEAAPPPCPPKKPKREHKHLSAGTSKGKGSPSTRETSLRRKPRGKVNTLQL